MVRFRRSRPDGTLGFDRRRKIRDLIRRNQPALPALGQIVSTEETSGSRPGRAFWLTKAQALFLCTKSETARATEATIEMVRVFEAFTKGRLDVSIDPVTERIEARPTIAPPVLPSPPSAIPILKDGQAIIRVCGKTVLIDTKRYRVGPDDLVLCVHHEGHITIGNMRETVTNWLGSRGYQEAWRKPKRSEHVGAEKVSGVVQVLGVVVQVVDQTSATWSDDEAEMPKGLTRRLPPSRKTLPIAPPDRVLGAVPVWSRLTLGSA